ncbi:MAG: glycosyltransferase family 4 protein [Lachnospiraceae bacterium]|nr:glycosyltransferase family 4 protein [Lachnospiraceae bacterium]
MGIKTVIKRVVSDDVIVRMKSLLEHRNNQIMGRKAAGLRPYSRESHPFGINLIGDIRAETGLGQSMRILAGLLERAGIPFCIIQADSPGGLEHSDTQWEHRLSAEARYGINLLHINPSIWAESYNRLPVELLDGRYQIAYWLWELEDFPREWIPCIDTVDEIWAPSEFICRSIRAVTDKPVAVIPYILRDMGEDIRYGRQHFGLPEEKFLYLVMYDFKSISERKNPRGALEAYKKAFPRERADVGLVVKVSHAGESRELQLLGKELEAYHNVYFITDNLSRSEVESLIAGVNVLVSLHRSEGFGLPMAEAMAMGTPIVCTNWSATTEFMDQTCACLVDYSLITLEKRIGPYQKGSRWADADTEQAAGLIRRLREEPDFYEGMAAEGRKKVQEYLSFERAKAALDERMDRI